MPNGDNLIWIDLEMTGLNTDSDAIIEIATVVTDKDLNIVAEGPELAIHQSDEVLARMMLNKWLEYCVERGHRFSASTGSGSGA